MHQLQFSPFRFRFKNSENKVVIFDEIRKKFIQLTPEEWVRQHVVHHFIYEKKYPKSLINVEKQIQVNGQTKRYDVVVYHPDGRLRILVECKAPGVSITQATFDQIARYNTALRADFLMVTNGLNHYFCQMDFEQEQYRFITELPSHHSL